MAAKHVYSFGDGSADGSNRDKLLLGGKGAGLAEMSHPFMTSCRNPLFTSRSLAVRVSSSSAAASFSLGAAMGYHKCFWLCCYKSFRLYHHNCLLSCDYTWIMQPPHTCGPLQCVTAAQPARYASSSGPRAEAA